MNVVPESVAAKLGVWPFLTMAATAAIAALMIIHTGTASAKQATPGKPTVLLVHGAFAESSSWNGVAASLLAKGYPVVAVANPLRSVKVDAGMVASVIDSVAGPVILVGHSYGGSVISQAAAGKPNVKALVYVSAFVPEVGETAAGLSVRFPGSTLGPTLAPPVPLPDGGKDLYIQPAKFHQQFAADVPVADAELMAATQRPITEAALNEPATAAAWKTIPSWFLYGSLDKNIPAAAHAFMAKRAGAKEVLEIKGASHVVMTSHPAALVKMIEQASAQVSKDQ